MVEISQNNVIPGLLVIVPCGQKKIWGNNPNAKSTAARNAYTGSPFVVNRKFADHFAEAWFVLSAKYGFIQPDFAIPGPYNVTFKKKTTKPVTTAKLSEQVQRLELNQFSTVIGLGGKEYRHAIQAAFEGTSVKPIFPFEGLPIGKAMQATNRAIKTNDPFRRSGESVAASKDSAPDTTINQTCQTIHEWFRKLPSFGFPYDSDQLPRNGIYVLFEHGESAHDAERIVRVGTHTGNNQLRARLKQHFVNENKDRSIFRKNIGRCLLNREGDPFLKSWELDLTSRKAKDAYDGQIDFEKQKKIEGRVSEYIQNHFTFVVFNVPEKDKRLELESKITSTVSLCDGCGSSNTWLGSHSPKKKIRESGIWQVNELYKTPFSDESLLELQSYLVGCR